MARYETFHVKNLHVDTIKARPESTDTIKVANEFVTSGVEAETFWAGAPKYAPINLNDWIWYQEDFDGKTPILSNYSSTGTWGADNEPCPPWQYADDNLATYALTDTDVGGVLSISPADGTPDSGVAMRLGHNSHGNLFEIVGASGQKLWYETRVKLVGVTGSHVSMFVGLGDESTAAVDFLADTGSDFADDDLIGFHVEEKHKAGINFAYQTTGTAFVEIDDVATNASDWHKLGFFYDGVDTITIFADDTANTTTVAYNDGTFPDGEELSPLIAIKTHTASSQTLYVDWITCVMERGI